MLLNPTDSPPLRVPKLRRMTGITENAFINTKNRTYTIALKNYFKMLAALIFCIIPHNAVPGGINPTSKRQRLIS